MKLPLVSRRRHERELEHIKADRERIRGERDQFAEDRDAQRAVARTATRQFSEADAANRRLSARNLELGRRISALAEADPEYAASLERRVARLLKVGERLRAAYALEQHRTDKRQALDKDADRKAIEEWERRVKAHHAWTSPVDLEKRPVDGGSWRPTHPAIALRRALDRCRALEERLATAERRTRVVSGS